MIALWFLSTSRSAFASTESALSTDSAASKDSAASNDSTIRQPFAASIGTIFEQHLTSGAFDSFRFDSPRLSWGYLWPLYGHRVTVAANVTRAWWPSRTKSEIAQSTHCVVRHDNADCRVHGRPSIKHIDSKGYENVYKKIIKINKLVGNNWWINRLDQLD